MWEGGCKVIHYAFFDNVVRGKSALFRLVARNGLAHFARKVFVNRQLLSGKFWVFAPLSTGLGIIPKKYHFFEFFLVHP